MSQEAIETTPSGCSATAKDTVPKPVFALAFYLGAAAHGGNHGRFCMCKQACGGTCRWHWGGADAVRVKQGRTQLRHRNVAVLPDDLGKQGAERIAFAFAFQPTQRRGGRLTGRPNGQRQRAPVAGDTL